MRVRAKETVFLSTRIYRKGEVFEMLGTPTLDPDGPLEPADDAPVTSEAASTPTAPPAKPRRRARVTVEVLPLPGAADSKLAQMME